MMHKREASRVVWFVDFDEERARACRALWQGSEKIFCERY